ncbi:MAG: amino acid adenylation domain-containing protein [Candidatus Margulisbacteria bacterium]|nr:amino acid adenylation domain-containing protein [Candidatus Margulisiibacteriota bacterium]
MSAAEEGSVFYPLTFIQRDIWNTQQFYRDEPLWNLGGYIKIFGSLQLEKFQQMVNILIDDNDILRSVFVTDNQTPYLKINTAVNYQLPVRDFRAEQNPQEAAISWMKQQMLISFDVSKFPLFEYVLLQITDNETYWFHKYHHLIMDGYGEYLIMTQAGRIYNCLLEGKEYQVQRLSYTAYVQDEQKYLSSLQYNQDKEYWKIRFAELPDNLFARKRREIKDRSSLKSGMRNMYISRAVLQKLKELATQQNVSLAHIFYSIFLTYFQKIADVKQFVAGLPILNRKNAASKKTVGPMFGIVPLKVEVQQDMLFTDFVQQLKKDLLQDYRHHRFPVSGIIDRSFTEQVLRPFYQVFLGYEPFSYEQVTFSGQKTDGDVFTNSSEWHDLKIVIRDLFDAQDIKIELVYNYEFFSDKDMEIMEQSLATLIEDILAGPSKPIKDFNLVPEQEKQKLLKEFNRQYAFTNENQTVPDLIESQVRSNPGNIVLICREKEFTYEEIYTRALEMSCALREEHHVRPNQIVAVCCQRSERLVETLLGVWLAGAGFLVVATDLPLERIKKMLGTSGCKLLLTDHQETIGLEGHETKIVSIDKLIYNNNIALKNSGIRHLAYEIFTSGSTGEPKGVMVSHENLMSFVGAMQERIALRKNQTILAVSSVAFDIFFIETLIALALGLKVVMADDEEVKDPELLKQLLLKQKIDVLQLTPSRLKWFLANTTKSEWLSGIKTMLVGAETLNEDLFRLLTTNCKGNIYYLYGTTETTIWSTVKKLEPAETLTVGRPLSNTRIYILNKFLQLCPWGISGEIYIGGDCVSAGYAGAAGLTRQSFIDDPFNPGWKMYKTGDIGRWLENGELEFIGRKDDQVKIRGHRVECAEVEKAILNFPGITTAAVLAKEDNQGNSNLFAWLAGVDKSALFGLQAFLKQLLPEYMLPSCFVLLKEFPLTTGGKLDKQALKKLQVEPVRFQTFVSPENDLEEKLLEVWQTVLPRQNISVSDNFFSIGGDSINVFALVLKIEKVFGIALSIRDIFERQSIRETAILIKEKKNSRKTEPIEPATIKDLYALAAIQKQIFLLQQKSGASWHYNIAAIFLITGQLDLPKLEKTLQIMVNRHENFRSAIVLQDGQPLLRIFDSLNPTLKVMDFKDQEQILQHIEALDIFTPQLFTVQVFKKSDLEHYLLLNIHHIIADGLSVEIFMKEWLQLYEGKVLPVLSLQYKDFVCWQESRLRERKWEKQKAYWLKTLQGELPVLQLPTDEPRPVTQDHEGERIYFSLSRETSEQLKNLAEQQKVTLYNLLLAAYFMLLYRYTGQQDLIVGLNASGRTEEGLQNMVGVFNNILPLRAKLNGSKTFKDLLGDIKNEVTAALENQDYPMEEVVRELSVRRDRSRDLLFDTLFGQQIENVVDYVAGELRVSVVPRQTKIIAHVDVAMTVISTDKEIGLYTDYSKALFKKETIARLIAHYQNMLREISRAPDLEIAKVNFLTEVEQNLFFAPKSVAGSHVQELTIVDLFEEQAKRNPQNVAVIFNNQILTYAELNVRANQLAHYLREKYQVKPDEVVGIKLGRSQNLAIAVLGVLKAGGAYLPLDINYHSQRLMAMKEQSGCRVVLTEKDILHSEYPLHNTEKVNRPQDLAYVIFTSGTTGRPKGVMVEHRNLAAITEAWKELYQLKEGRVRLLQLSSFSFDAFTGDMAKALLTGGQLIIASGEDKFDLAKICEYLEEYQINILESTPSYIKLLAEYMQQNNVEKKYLKTVIIGGESCPKPVFQYLRKQLGDLQLVNGYGTTECTVESCIYEANAETSIQSKNTPIGRPLSLAELYILDADRNIMPVGCSGELYIGGAGVSRGYINEPQLTAAKFVPNPFKPGERLYRSGDLARYLPDGNIEYIGRADEQVKIRGYRIECSEVEAALLALPGVKEVKVIAKSTINDASQLVAYLVTEREIEKNLLKEQLLLKLPGFMMPSFFVGLKEMPRNVNGKVDVSALPEPDFFKEIDQSEEIFDGLELQLKSIWQEVLRIKKFGAHDSFFELGGDSLGLLTVLTALQKKLNIELKFSELFEKSTIRKLAEHIRAVRRGSAEPISRNAPRESYPLSSGQRRMYVLHKLAQDSVSYNIPMALKIEGELDKAMLGTAIQAVIDKQEQLRVGFEIVDGELVQKVQKNITFRLDEADLTDEAELARQIKLFIQPFDLQSPPLFRVKLLHYAGDKKILLVDMHHIISDGVSIEIFMENILEVYENQLAADLNIQYTDYVLWREKYKQSEKYKEQESYWLNKLQGPLPVLNMPTDFPRPALQSFEGDRVQLIITESQLQALEKLAASNEATLFMVLYAAYILLLQRYSGQDDIMVGLAVSGRNHPDTNSLIGIFVNTLIMRTDLKDIRTFEELLKLVKTNILEAFDNQDFQIEDLLEKLQIKRDVSRNVLFDTMFVLQNMEKPEFKREHLTLQNYDLEQKTAKIDFTFFAVPLEKGMKVELEFCTKLFKKETMERFLEHYLNIINNLIQ